MLIDSVLKRCVQDARGLLVMKIMLPVLLFMLDIFWLNETQSRSKIKTKLFVKSFLELKVILKRLNKYRVLSCKVEM